MPETLTLEVIEKKVETITSTKALKNSLNELHHYDVKNLSDDLNIYFKKMWSELLNEFYGAQNQEAIYTRLLQLHFIFSLGTISNEVVVDLANRLALKHELQSYLFVILNDLEVQKEENTFTHLLASALLNY